MARTEQEQLKYLFGSSKHVLIVFPKEDTGDAIGSAIALNTWLASQGKQVDMVSHDFVLPQKFAFLEHAQHIANKVPHLQQLLISIDVKDAGLQELSYDVKDQKLQIFVTPQSGFLTRQHVTTSQSDFRYDMVITLGAHDLEELGPLYTKNANLFYDVPVINIDHDIKNDHYGTLNIIDLTASSTAEVVTNMMIDTAASHINTVVATSLLTGMIAATNSFKIEHIKPHTLALASKLVSMGADRDFIIKQLYQTKTLSTLRLWGQALAHLSYDESIGLVSTAISRADFATSGANEHQLYDIIEELIANSPEAELTLLLHEHAEKDSRRVHAILRVEKAYNAKEILSGLGGSGNAHQASVTLEDVSLEQAKEHIVKEIKNAKA